MPSRINSIRWRGMSHNQRQTSTRAWLRSPTNTSHFSRSLQTTTTQSRNIFMRQRTATLIEFSEFADLEAQRPTSQNRRVPDQQSSTSMVFLTRVRRSVWMDWTRWRSFSQTRASMFGSITIEAIASVDSMSRSIPQCMRDFGTTVSRRWPITTSRLC